MEGPLVWPGQHAGFLGPRHDPWQIRQDPNRQGFRVDDSLSLPAGFSVQRMEGRQALLAQFQAHRDALDGRASRVSDPMSEQRQRAMSLLLSGKVSRAFDLSLEDPRLRDRYGRHMYGQSLLLARRLVEAGVPIVQVNMGRVQSWDTRSANFTSLKERLLPPTDRGVAALLDDMESRGLLDETLVVVTGEFGRTPRIGASTGNNNTRDGPDHWQPSSRPPLPGEAFREARPSAVPTRSALTPPAAPTLRPILPRPSTRASESILPPRSAIA